MERLRIFGGLAVAGLWAGLVLVCPGCAETDALPLDPRPEDDPVQDSAPEQDGPLQTGGSVTDNEVLAGVATDESFLLQVFPFAIGSQAVPYTVSIEAARGISCLISPRHRSVISSAGPSESRPTTISTPLPPAACDTRMQ